MRNSGPEVSARVHQFSLLEFCENMSICQIDRPALYGSLSARCKCGKLTCKRLLLISAPPDSYEYVLLQLWSPTLCKQTVTSRYLARLYPAFTLFCPRPPALPSTPDDEIQSGAAVLADEPQPSSGVEGAACVDTRVGGAYVRGQVQADFRAAGLPGELHNSKQMRPLTLVLLNPSPLPKLSHTNSRYFVSETRLYGG